MLLYIYKKIEVVNLLLLSISWFSLKLELVSNTTILSDRSQLVYPYGRDPFVPGIFIDMASVSESPMTLASHVPFEMVYIILRY